MIMAKNSKAGAKAPSSDTSNAGYGSPPKVNQFKKGESGNPSGRPKGSLNVREALERHLHRTVQVREGGRARTMTVFDAMIMAAITSACRGNLKMIEWILSVVSSSRSLEELMRGRPVFEFTPEEAARFSQERLLERVTPKNDDDDDGDKKVIL
jgi:hypothetical protein